MADNRVFVIREDGPKGRYLGRFLAQLPEVAAKGAAQGILRALAVEPIKGKPGMFKCLPEGQRIHVQEWSKPR